MAKNDLFEMQALDHGLAELLSKPRGLDAMPLAVRRFAQRQGATSVTRALEEVTAELLSVYFRCYPKATKYISVSRLSHLCGARLVGAPQQAAKREAAYYSVLAPPVTRSHAAILFFEDGRPVVRVPPLLGGRVARTSIAHELGHLLIHRNNAGFDSNTMCLPSSREEEALAEYASRLLLLPRFTEDAVRGQLNLAERAVSEASDAGITLHSAVARLGDPDQPRIGIRGAILWRLNDRIPSSFPTHERLTPQWHLCPKSFIPIKKCHARETSLVAELAELGNTKAAATRFEEVTIGSLKGKFHTDALAWGSLKEGTRLVLSVFHSQS